MAVRKTNRQYETEILKLSQEKEYFKNQLMKASGKIIKLRQEIKEWQQAADGLARMIEEMEAKEGAEPQTSNTS